MCFDFCCGCALIVICDYVLLLLASLYFVFLLLYFGWLLRLILIVAQWWLLTYLVVFLFVFTFCSVLVVINCLCCLFGFCVLHLLFAFWLLFLFVVCFGVVWFVYLALLVYVVVCLRVDCVDCFVCCLVVFFVAWFVICDFLVSFWSVVLYCYLCIGLFVRCLVFGFGVMLLVLCRWFDVLHDVCAFVVISEFICYLLVVVMIGLVVFWELFGVGYFVLLSLYLLFCGCQCLYLLCGAFTSFVLVCWHLRGLCWLVSFVLCLVTCLLVGFVFTSGFWFGGLLGFIDLSLDCLCVLFAIGFTVMVLLLDWCCLCLCLVVALVFCVICIYFAGSFRFDCLLLFCLLCCVVWQLFMFGSASVFASWIWC